MAARAGRYTLTGSPPAANFARWLSLPLVALLHALFLAGLLLDRPHPTLPPLQSAPLRLLHLPPTRPALDDFRPRNSGQWSVPAPILPLPPPIAIQSGGEARPWQLPPQGLDLSLRPGGRVPLEQMSPDAALRRKRFLTEQARNDAIDNAPSPAQGDDDCAAVMPNANDPTALPNAFSIGRIPVIECRPHQTLRALQRRNDLLAPH